MNRSLNQRRRAGMTILEVLFAIMITTVGLLGAIAVFPVASEYARKGRLNDELAVCAESAVHNIDAKGMRRPDHWISWQLNMGSWQQLNFPAIVQPGVSYCLDPRFMAANLQINNSPPPAYYPTYAQPQEVYFPAFPYQTVAGPNHPDGGGNPGAPRMQRISLLGFPGSNPNVPMGRFQADYAFGIEDQLTYERPGVQKGLTGNDNSRPAFQIYTPIKDVNSGLTFPGKREDDGKLSWLATFVPTIDRWNGTLDDKYVLSIVVFYGRSPSLAIPDFSQPLTTPVNEWTATILGTDFYSNGFGGGEVTISVPSSDPNASDKLKVRAGDWVMLSGLQPGRNGAGNLIPVQVYKWYRVSDADEDPYGPVNGTNGISYMRRDVTLVGPDWDMQDILPVSGPDGVFDDVEVTIVPHVVAVFDRTVRLEQDGTGN